MTAKLLLGSVLMCACLRAGTWADRYTARLGQLDTTSPQSVCDARTALHEMLPKASSADRTAMFRALVDFSTKTDRATSARFSSAVRPITDRLLAALLKTPGWSDGSPETARVINSDPEFRRALTPWLKCGFRIRVAEGTLETDADPESRVEFAPQLPVAMKAFVLFQANEDRLHPVIAGDATLQITWVQLAERLQRWERLLQHYPTLKPEMDREIRFMAGMLFCGIDNTPLIRPDGRIDPHALLAWRRYTANGYKSRYSDLAHELISRVEKNDNRLAPEGRALTNWVYTEWFGTPPPRR